MITENDIIFDNIYEDIALTLDTILDEAIGDIKDDFEITDSMMMRVVEMWSLGVSIRLPLVVKVDNKKEVSDE
tara:strand:+ start:417 stop:635 length:219 start_codon:yes stop_codon:yes gene_type:complete